MQKLLRHFALIASVGLSSAEAYAAPPLVIPPTSNTLVVSPVKAPSTDSTAQLLNPERHLTLTRVRRFDVFTINSPEYELYQKQLQAMEFAGMNQLAQLIPQLLSYADYPANNHTNSPFVPDGSIPRSSIKSVWPAYWSIVRMGPQASPELQKFIAEPQQPLRLRLTALQILRDINLTDAQIAARQLQAETQKSGQTGAFYFVGSILSGQLPFWGKINFSPVILTEKQVTELLTPERYIQDVSILLLFHSFEPQFRAKFTQGRDLKGEYALYVQQKEAIRTAGELRFLPMIPNLVQFMDYPTDGGAGIGLTSPDDNTHSGDRRKYVAIDAILKMGKAASTPLSAIASDSKMDIKLRLRALYVLHYVDDQAAQTAAQIMVTEFEKTNDTKTVKRIQSAVSRFSLQRLMAQVR